MLFCLGVAIMLGPGMLMQHGAEKIDRDKILDHDREWQVVYDEYRVDFSYLDTLKAKVGDDLVINVYLGLWCKDSKENVPKFIKVLDIVRPESITVNYYTVERKANAGVKYFVEEFKVERVPTFIFYRRDQELGRIVEHPRKDMLEEILDIVF